MIIKILLGVLIGGAVGAGVGYLGKRASRTLPVNPLRGAISGMLMGILLVLIFTQRPLAQYEKPDEELFQVNTEVEFKAHVLDVGGICLVNFASERYPACQLFAPTVSLLAEQYADRVTVSNVDVDKLANIARRYNVRNVPTVVIINNGNEVERLVGAHPKSEYTAVLNRLIREARR